MDYLMTGLGLLLAYLLGSIPTSVWVGKWFYGRDVRDEGSGNAGATNTIRVLGYRAGIPVVIIDILKGVAAVLLMQYFIPPDWSQSTDTYLLIMAGLLSVVGHTLPIFAGFRGGKGVATLFGIGLALYGWPVVMSFGVFIVVVALTRYVSLGSMLAGLSFPFFAIWLFRIHHPGLAILAVFATLFILWTHRTNISRLLKGEERKLWLSKSGQVEE